MYEDILEECYENCGVSCWVCEVCECCKLEAGSFWLWVRIHLLNNWKWANSDYLTRIFWANAGLGLASVPHFWKVFHEGDVTVHRADILSFEKENVLVLSNGTRITTDEVVLCTGFLPNLNTFSEELRTQYNISSLIDKSPKTVKLDLLGEQIVDELLPLLQYPPDTNIAPPTKRPSTLYRRLISPAAAAKGDRTIFFPGLIHSVFTPLVAEFQALWGVAFMLGMIDVPSEEEMNIEVTTWNAWSRKRYLEQGRKHAYAIYDYLSVCTFLWWL